LLDYVAVGMAHILSGTDHLLYLLTIVVAAAGWRYWLSVLTSFTVAHSVTLSLGLMGWIKVNALVVEPLIAVSIVLMALLNLVQREAVVSRALIRQRMALVFACGLLHGLGFASSMAEMGLNSAYRLTSLLGFNLGIEVGQAVFVLAVLMLQTAVVWGSRLSIQRLPVAMAVLTRQRVGLLTSALACLVGSFWLAQRLLVWV
jgi:hydrogenase/urease accessory protein HupE